MSQKIKKILKLKRKRKTVSLTAYSKNIDQIRGLTNFDNVIRTSTYFNSNFADENFNLFGRKHEIISRFNSGPLRRNLRNHDHNK